MRSDVIADLSITTKLSPSGGEEKWSCDDVLLLVSLGHVLQRMAGHPKARCNGTPCKLQTDAIASCTYFLLRRKNDASSGGGMYQEKKLIMSGARRQGVTEEAEGEAPPQQN
jgi:hypothetical protein